MSDKIKMKFFQSLGETIAGHITQADNETLLFLWREDKSLHGQQPSSDPPATVEAKNVKSLFPPPVSYL